MRRVEQVIGFPVSLRIDDENTSQETADPVFAWLRGGTSRFCLNAGGDVVAAGGPWRVGVRHPERADRLCTVREITDGVVATSARYRTLAQCSTLQGGGVGHPRPGGPEGRRTMASSPCPAT
jgi:hypothetical protein